MNIKKEYLSRFKNAIPKSLPQKSSVLQQLGQTIDEYLEINNEPTLEKMIQDLGTPEEVASEYYENQFSDELLYIHKRHVFIISIILAIFVILFSVGLMYVYQYWPTTTIYETAIEITQNTP